MNIPVICNNVDNKRIIENSGIVLSKNPNMKKLEAV